MMWTTGRGCAPAVEILWLLCGLSADEVESTGHGRPSSVVLVPHSNIRRPLRLRSATMLATGPTPVGRHQPQMVCRPGCPTTAWNSPSPVATPSSGTPQRCGRELDATDVASSGDVGVVEFTTRGRGSGARWRRGLG